MATFTSNERRRSPRVQVKVPFKYRITEGKKTLKTREELIRCTRHGFTLDIGLGGMNVVLDDPLRVGDVVPFEIFLFHQVNRVEVFSRVQWVGLQNFGLRFLLMKPQDHFCLGQFLESVGQAQSGVAQRLADEPDVRLDERARLLSRSQTTRPPRDGAEDR